MFTADPVVISAMTDTGKFIRMVAFLAVGVTSLMCQSQIVLAQSAPGIAAASLDDEKVNTIRRKTYPGQIYANTDVLVCGKETVVITSTCVANDGDNSDPYCFSQNVSFVQIQKRQAVSFFYSYEQDKQKFIYGAACLKHKDRFFVELMNSNFGNCKSCEWYDYFSANGSYIGSSDGQNGKTSFRKIKMTKKLDDMLLGTSRLEEIVLTTIAH